MNKLKRVCVYCGSSDHVAPDYLGAATALGQALAARKIGVVFGGGRTGMMGALADAMLAADAEVVGIIPKRFDTPALAHLGLTELRVVETMHERKAAMASLADAFIALPGGFGTFEELFEILTWAQLGIHSRPVGVLNAKGYFNLLLSLIEHARGEGFIYDEHRSLLISESNPDALLARLALYHPPEGLKRWVERDEQH